MSKTKTKTTDQDEFYDYYCRSCSEEWTSNQVEHKCQNCGSESIVIEVKVPKIVRYTRRSVVSVEQQREPDFDWENEVRNAR